MAQCQSGKPIEKIQVSINNNEELVINISETHVFRPVRKRVSPLIFPPGASFFLCLRPKSNIFMQNSKWSHNLIGDCIANANSSRSVSKGSILEPFFYLIITLLVLQVLTQFRNKFLDNIIINPFRSV